MAVIPGYGLFGPVPASAWSAGLSDRAISVLGYYGLVCDKRNGRIKRSVGTLAKGMGKDAKYIWRAEAELVDAGYVTKRKNRVGGVVLRDPNPVRYSPKCDPPNVTGSDVTGSDVTDDSPISGCRPGSDVETSQEQLQKQKQQQKGEPARDPRQPVFECDDVSSPSRPTPTCPHCNESVSYLHSIPGRGGEMGCRQCAEKYRAA